MSARSLETRSLGEVAYDALRLAFIPWQRERRITKERERVKAARLSTRILSAGGRHSLALRVNAGVACWGSNDNGRAPPDGVDGDFVAIAAGARHSLALQSDGSVACWGDNTQWPVVPGDFVAIAAGGGHSLALRSDGNVACWGYNHHGQAPPEGVDGDFVAIAAGYNYSLALQRDGSVACWGNNGNRQAPPEGVAGPFVHTDE